MERQGDTSLPGQQRACTAQSQLLSCGLSGTEPGHRYSTETSSNANKCVLLRTLTPAPGAGGGEVCGVNEMQTAHGTGKEQDARQRGERPLTASPRARNQEEGQACLVGVDIRVPTAGLSGLQGGVWHVPAAWWASKPPTYMAGRQPVVAPGQCHQPALPGPRRRPERGNNHLFAGQRGSRAPHLPLDLDLMEKGRGSHDRAEAGRVIPLPRPQQEVASP